MSSHSACASRRDGRSERLPSVNEVALMRRRLLVFFVIAAMAASACGIGASAQEASRTSTKFTMRVVTSGLANPFQVIWGPDGYLWVTERTAGRVTRVQPSDGSKAVAITISDVLTDGPSGLLGMALDPDLLKGTGSDHVYVAYTYDADASPTTVNRRARIMRLTNDSSTPP